MFVKQVDMNEAFRLAMAGKEVKVLVPAGPGNGWEGMVPDTLQNMLGDVMFFRQEPAMRASELDDALQGSPPQKKTLMEQLRELPEAPRNRPASV